MSWLAGSPTCWLTSVMRSPPARRSHKFSHNCLIFGSSQMRFLYHTQRHTTVGGTRLDAWSARRRDLYLTTHNNHNRQTDIHASGGIRTYNLSRRAAVDLQLRPHGHWDRPRILSQKILINILTPHCVKTTYSLPWKIKFVKEVHFYQSYIHKVTNIGSWGFFSKCRHY